MIKLSLLNTFSKAVLSYRFFNSSAYDHDNLKKIKLGKRLIWTVLFGGTFVLALFKKKKPKSEAIKNSLLLPKNEHYGSKSKFYKYKDFVLPEFVMKNMDAVNQFQCRESDVFVVCFPKTGTTWLQEIVSCVMNDDKDFSLTKGIEDRFPYLEFVYPGLSSIDKMSDPRLIKTHLPFSLLPPDVLEKKPKIICLLRNPKDVAVSYYHFLRMFTIVNYVGNFDNFIDDMVMNKVPYGPVWKHYLDIWSHKDDSNILILFYEELQKDIYFSIEKIAQFLGKDLSDEEIKKIANHCSFTEMSSNPSVNYKHWDAIGLRNIKESEFMRKGIVGDWQNYFTERTNNEMDTWIRNNLGSSNIPFIYNVNKN